MQDRAPRYPSDTSDEQWAVIEPLLPPVRTGGRPEKHPRRAVVDAILYVVRAGCSWRQLPADFPPWQTVYWYFNQWEQAKVTEKILPVVRAQLRVQEGRNPEPSAGLIDSQSVKGADTVGRDTRGYDAGKKTSDAEDLSSGQCSGLLGKAWEGDGFGEADSPGEAVMEAADQAAEEVALGCGVSVTSVSATVIVGSGTR